jgi:hypothetical protein
LGVIASDAVTRAQQRPEHDHTAVVGIGWAGDWSRDDGLAPGGATLGVEVTPIEHWLSIETSVSAIHAEDGTELPVEVAFRKPWQLTPTLELMAGIAPEVVHRFGPAPETFGGVSLGAHIMVWPRPHVGWFAEGAYELAFPRAGTEKGIGLSAGLLIGN